MKVMTSSRCPIRPDPTYLVLLPLMSGIIVSKIGTFTGSARHAGDASRRPEALTDEHLALGSVLKPSPEFGHCRLSPIGFGRSLHQNYAAII
jgi:hypothetical protein